ncbi:hypothetical protein Leryth_013062 [Lithospermum erythrorhizon]|nr:hypothetical protein Leryth_013062 [Lithospermum erythrorhizon]
MGGKLHLFDENDEAENTNLSKIEINQEFARRYEHNKKREDFQRLEEFKKKGMITDSDSDDSSEEDEEIDGIVSQKGNKKELEKFIDALTKIKKQDPILMDKEVKLFDSETDDDVSEDGYESDDDKDGKFKKGDKKKKKKGVYMKDFNAKILNEKGADFVDELQGGEGVTVKSHSEEQEELRKEFLRSMEEEESGKDGDLFRLKEVKGGDDEEDEEEEEFEEKLNEYFSEDEKLDENEMFLKDYFRKRLWERKEERGIGDENGIEISEDEEEIERQEDYERDFNFRFEENTGDRILGHARHVEGSVRKKTNANKVQRDRKKERMEQAEMERKEELKRLKNLKKKEINEKLQKIRETAGIDGDGECPLDLDDLEEEFDPEEHDRKMKQAFGENYYKADDVDSDFGSEDEEHEDYLKKPDFDKEDELLGLPKGWGDSFSSVRERIMKQKEECEGDNENGEVEKNVVEEVGKRKRKKKTSEVEKAIREQLMEEYYKLDYEGTIGDLKTRFKYKPVKANRFGLKTEEVLMMDDKELNQYVSSSKLAPYREKEWEVPYPQVKKQKEKIREIIYGESSGVAIGSDKKRKMDKNLETDTGGPATDNQVKKTEESTADGSMSRKQRRKERNAEFKLSDSRLGAYGKAPSKPKSKK